MAAASSIADYALIGDCHGAALVSRGGSIDWACLTRFDSASVFARLLDLERGGCFALTPRGLREIRRRYLPDSNVLETRYLTETGAATVSDCMVMRPGGKTDPLSQLLRVIDGVSGSVSFDVLIEPRFDYGALHPWLDDHEGGVHTAVGGPSGMVVSCDAELTLDRAAVAWTAQLTVRAGQRSRFSIIAAAPHALEVRRVSAEVVDQRLQQTIDWWTRWVGQGRYDQRHRALAVRSALVLKLLTCAPTGAIIAAPTTSLPEAPGGPRNWDYRYSWIRDSTMTLGALRAVGHHEVAEGFKRFIMRSTAGSAPELLIMYGCYGERRLPEIELTHLAGYRGSRPVRIGNAAAQQRQLDVYGELLDAARMWQRIGHPPTPGEWRFLRSLVNAAATRWHEPDQGLWESRGPARHHVYSKAMCWLALERGIQAAEAASLPCQVERWRAVRADIRASIETHGIDPERGCFVQAYGSREVDASLLRLALIDFVSVHDPRFAATVAAVETDLSRDGLLERYRPAATDDGVTGAEGAFLLPSFWLVEILVMRGERARAEALFRRLVRFGNDLGLFSEQADPRTGELLGNFPQAFTHIALISAIDRLAR